VQGWGEAHHQLKVRAMNPAPVLDASVAGDPLARYMRALETMLTNRGSPSTEIDQVLERDPQFVPGHCLRAALIVRADNVAAKSKLAASLDVIEEMCPDVKDPARRHASAARAWLDGDQALAAERYGAILVDSPRDILALAVAHALDFRLGQRRMLRDRVAEVMPYWNDMLPGYASVLSMYAFGLEENGQYGRAERIGRRALALDPRHPGAIHAIAHVMEMQGRAREGLQFLAETESAWIDAKGISVHLAWHRALFHLSADDPASALAVYDAQIIRVRGSDLAELADASALLWRLQLRNVRLGERWQHLADRWQAQTLTGVRPFYVAHAMMALAAAHRTAAVRRVLDAVGQIEARHTLASHSEDALMALVSKALLAFSRGDYADCVTSLTRARHVAHRCGGSLAQCDLIQLTLTEAAARARRTPAGARRPTSQTGWRIRPRA
jgi:hypothetical protein